MNRCTYAHYFTFLNTRGTCTVYNCKQRERTTGVQPETL